MTNFFEEFMESFGPEVSRKLSGTLDLEEDRASQLLPQVAPLILSGLKRQKGTHGGIDRVDHILNKYGDDRVLDNLESMFSAKAGENNPDPTLGGLLGESGLQATSMLSEQFNIDGRLAAKIIPMLAPVILGFLTRKRAQSNVGNSGLAALLDQDGDGSILDDVAGFFMQNTGHRTGVGIGHIFKGVLGGLLGGQR